MFLHFPHFLLFVSSFFHCPFFFCFSFLSFFMFLFSIFSFCLFMLFSCFFSFFSSIFCFSHVFFGFSIFLFFHLRFPFFFFFSPTVRADAKTHKKSSMSSHCKRMIFCCEKLIFGPQWTGWEGKRGFRSGPFEGYSSFHVFLLHFSFFQVNFVAGISTQVWRESWSWVGPPTGERA